MKYTIKSLSDKELFSAEGDDLRAVVVAAVRAGAYLMGANLEGAYLEGADLMGADLRGADLMGAYLRGADLRGADLRGADLRGADLRGAKLDDATVIPTGENWKEYRTVVVPELLTNSLPIEQIVAEAWDVHEWTACPMAKRFHTAKLEGVPALLRPRAEQFIQFFDAHLLDDLPQEMGWLPTVEVKP